MNDAYLDAVRLVWNYMLLNQPLPEAVDVMIILGSRDDRVATCAASL